MTTSDLLITFASWEDRFRIGFDYNLEKVGFRKALVFYFGSYADAPKKIDRGFLRYVKKSVLNIFQ